MITWENHRRINGTVDLVDALGATGKIGPRTSVASVIKARAFLADVEDLCPIRSRQAAAVAVSTATSMLEDRK